LTSIDSLRPVSLASGARLRVVTTVDLVTDVVGQVGGEVIDLTGLMPVGADPHSYEPTPQDLRLIAQADVVFVNDLGLETFLGKVLDTLNGKAVVVSLSEGIQPLTGGAGAAGPQGVDPHVWFDPAKVAVWADNASRALSALDPAHAAAYQADATRYRAQVTDLDGWITAQVATVPPERRKLVTDHDELGYFAAKYGFQIIGAVIPSYSTVSEPSAQQLAQLEKVIGSAGVKAVFVGTTVNPALSQRIAQDTGAQLVPLYTETLSSPGGPAADYLDFMRYNVDAIVGALR
jgi:ABC-type Zn uptake system ZnuABC Zn-binding protein ZnuA